MLLSGGSRTINRLCERRLMTAINQLSREEYIEQEYFFKTYRERLKDIVPSQDILKTIQEELLSTCPDKVLSKQERGQLAQRLREGQRAVAATRALVDASSQPIAVSMEAMRPWHLLVTEVWQLSARLRKETP